MRVGSFLKDEWYYKEQDIILMFERKVFNQGVFFAFNLRIRNSGREHKPEAKTAKLTENHGKDNTWRQENNYTVT